MIKSYYYTPDDGLVKWEGIRAFGELTRREDAILWVDMIAPTDEESYVLTSEFGFHPLAVEDVLSEMSRPKVDDYDDFLFTVAKVLGPPLQDKDIEIRPVGIFLTKNSVVTVHFFKMRALAAVAARLDRDSRLISRSADFFFHTILDHIVDTYFHALNLLEHEVDRVEVEVLDSLDEDILKKMFHIRRDLSLIGRMIAPQAEVVTRVTRDNFPLISEKCAVYFSDIHDHLQVMLSTTGNQRESISSAMDLYFSIISTKTNQVIKLLTILTALFLPATFIVGFYGMNFVSMPELHWKFGYPLAIGLILVVVVGLLIFFKKRRWI
ncbi:MAG: magnesium/cobalt transporter CorA [candidate division Zixibacteria bacterium]|nr:magnesium/cobalt transporter CorA [candidate division Zixibacteria bacterium]